MEKTIRIDRKIIKKGGPDGFALQTVLKNTKVRYEYKIDGQWTFDKPNKKPEGEKIIFQNINTFRAAKDVYFAWQSISRLHNFDPVFPDKIMQRLVDSRLTSNQCILFTPWGVRLKGEPRLETKVLDKIQLLQIILQEKNINVQVLLMPADIYAKEINRVDAKQTDNYFDFITKEAKKREFEVKTWSQIKNENRQLYSQIFSEIDMKGMPYILPNNIIDGAFQSSRKRSGFSTQENIEKAALAYLRERICEAEIIEKIYKPIKISVVGKHKDNHVDCNLPRLYILPASELFPWLS